MMIAHLRKLLLAILVAAALAPAAAFAAPEAAWGRIELLRDRWGTPHVFAATDEGAMYGLGWATAEDRGFQMTWSLRIIQGRSAEVLGERTKANRNETTIESDRKMRTFGFHRAARETARRLDRPTLALLQAYSRGVNDSFAAQGKERHTLFDKLGLEPEPWTPADCLASWWHLGQFFATDGTRDLLHWHSLREGGLLGGRTASSATRSAAPMRGRSKSATREGAPPRINMTPDDAAAVIQRGDVTDAWLAEVRAFAEEHGMGSPVTGSGDGPKFSHSWVVGGAKTGGGAVLMSDPQTPVNNPSLFYEFHVQGKTFNARGIGVPGSPALLIGWNEAVAWGLTALGADQADLFRLQTDRDHPGQYQLDGEWLDMEVIEERILVKGARPQSIKIQQTRFGPVVSEFAFPRPGDPPVALKRIPVCEPERETIQGAFAMMRAGTLAEFTRALAGWRFPSANIVFGDRSGAIGFWLLGAFPLRKAGAAPDLGRAAIDGSSASHDWQAFVPHELMPHAIDPARGWLASANHRPIASFYPIELGLSTGGSGDTVRSWRLRELLSARERFTPRDVLDVHYDEVNPARRELARLGLHLRDTCHRPLSENTRAVLDLLKPWLEAGARSNLATSGAVLAQQINTMFRLMQTDLALQYGGGESGLARFLKEARARIDAGLPAPFSSAPVPFGPLVEEYVGGVLEEAWAAAREQYGPDPARWPARAQAAAARRPMPYYQSLDGFGSLAPARDVNAPPLECIDGGTIRSQAAQSYSQWVPLGEVDQALSILPPGASERPGSPGWLATMELWKEGKLHPAPLTRGAVEPLAVSRTKLSD